MKFIFWFFFISIGNIYSLIKTIVLYIFYIYNQGSFFHIEFSFRIILTIWIECITTKPLTMESGPLRDLLDTTLWDTVLSVTCGSSVGFPVTAISSTNKSDGQNIIEILLKVVSKTISLTLPSPQHGNRKPLVVRHNIQWTKQWQTIVDKSLHSKLTIKQHESY